MCLFMRSLQMLQRYASSALIIGFCLASGGKAQAFTQVVISTGAPSGLETQFISATTSQFSASVFKNPLAANTYGVTLYGFNPNYQAPPAPPSTLQTALSLGATVYVYGFGDGMSYNQKVAQNLVGYLGMLCGSATNYQLVQTSSTTFDRSTCQDVVGTIIGQFTLLSSSVPTPIPPQP
jgi:hypothetical protein